MTSPCLPELEAHYTLCSSVYGDHVFVPPDATVDEAFLDAVERGYEDGVLHDCGHLAMERATRKMCFLVAATLNKGTTLGEQELLQLSTEVGLPARLMTSTFEGQTRCLVVAQLDRVEDFDKPPVLVSAVFKRQAS